MYAKQDGIWNEYDDNNVRQVPGEMVSNSDIYIAFLTRTALFESMNANFCKRIVGIRNMNIQQQQEKPQEQQEQQEKAMTA